MSCSLPERVVCSAASLTSSKFSSSQAPNSRASRALSKRNAGARCMRSSMIVVLTPPASRTSFMPRLYEARSVPSALGVLAVDQERPGDAERDLGDADEVLDVAGGDVGVERVARDVLELDLGVLFDEGAPLVSGLARVVVIAVARDRRAAVRAGFSHQFLLGAAYRDA